MTERYSTIQIRDTNISKKVLIGSKFKPVILEEVIDKWQSLLNVITEIAEVPAGLIMKLNEDTIEVFLSSEHEGNPYERGEKADLVYGLYCETVIGRKEFATH